MSLPRFCTPPVALAALITAVSPAATANDARADLSSLLAELHDFVPIRFAESGTKGLVEVEINGVKGLLHIDTGCNTSNLYVAALPKFGLTARATGETIAGLAGTERLSRAAYSSFSLGRVAFPSGEFAVTSANQFPDCDGILGTDFLARAGAVLAMRSGRLYLTGSGRPGDESVKPGALAAKSGHIAIPLRRASGTNLIDVTIAGVPASLLLDTGAQQTLLDAAFAKRSGLAVEGVPAEASGTGGSAGVRLGYAVPASINLGAYPLRGLACMVADLGPVSSHGIQGLFGGELLARLDAHIDVAGGVMYLAPVPPPLDDIGVFPGNFPDGFAPGPQLAAHPLVFSGTLAAAPEILPDAPGARPARARLRWRIAEILKDVSGNRKHGDIVETVVTAPPGPEPASARVRTALARKPFAIVFAGAEPPEPLGEAVVAGSPARLAALRAAQAPGATRDTTTR